MSVRTLPLVFINLGGEMLYILDQRLQALNTSEDNSEKGVWSENDRKRVMNDIVGAMFNKDFMDELLKPQQLYSHRTLKTVLTRLAHTSIMRLNQASMDKLYELMVMAFKYQVFLCPRPKDLLLITYNHIDTIREFVRHTPVVVNQVDETHRKIIEMYSSLPEGEFQLLRQTLLIFFQDMHVRVSLFLKNKVQNPNGRFALLPSGPVPHGVDVPGLIRMFDRKGREGRRGEFPTGGSYTSPIRQGCFELHGDRVIRLGMNMYHGNHPEETHTSKAPSVKKDDTPNLLAKEELNLLARLMGSMKAEHRPETKTFGFRINLFSTDQEEEDAEASVGAEDSLFGVINIQAMQDEQAATELARIAGQFAEVGEMPKEHSSSSKGDDLLAMMDDL
ncbi:protein OSCP1a [Clinocottus analis]|uniref:protein OSCP1a n=1 Tax=Clinocottus analis TaxID=304258 RepID=UPI0035C0FC71